MYESLFGLSGPAFQLNPDPTFLFDSTGHSAARNYLRFGVFQGEGFIVITGEIGAGKTTLIRALLGELDPAKIVAAQLVSTHLDATDLLRAICAAFGVQSRGSTKAEMLGSLEAFLTSLAVEDRRALLIVDEAQNLTLEAIEELRMLSNFQLGSRALLQSFLIGQPELRLTLRSPMLTQFRERVIASCHLGPLTQEETGQYIEHRLRRVGWNNDPEFGPGAFEAVYRWTKGVPRKINLLCNRVLLAAFLAQSHAITAENVDVAAREAQAEISGLSPLEGADQASEGHAAGPSRPLVAPRFAAPPPASPSPSSLTRAQDPYLPDEAQSGPLAPVVRQVLRPLVFLIDGHREFVRLQPLLSALVESQQISNVEILQASTPLEHELTRLVAADLGVAAPRICVEVDSGSHAEQTTETMPLFELIVEQYRPTALVLLGDSNSALACAMVAAKDGVRVVHLRAGLRCFDRSVPEEINRVLIEQICQLLFTVERVGQVNLRREGLGHDRVHFVGSLAADAVRFAQAKAVPLADTFHRLGVEDKLVRADRGYGAVLVKQPGDHVPRADLMELAVMLRELSKLAPIVWVIHPRMKQILDGLGLSESVQKARVVIVATVRYLEVLGVLAKASYILTDMNGVQEEATVLGVPCLTLASATELRATLTEGTNTLVGRDLKRAMTEVAEVLESGGKRDRQPELWDGHAGERIAAVLGEWARGEPAAAQVLVERQVN